MRITTVAPASIAALSLVAGLAHAAPYAIDPSHAAIQFEVSHLGFSNTQFRFNSFDADIDYNPETPSESSIMLTIDATSLDSNWPKRDDHVRSADFLDVENHPTITFESTAISMDGDNQATVTGNLTMLGVTNEETFDVTLIGQGPHPFNGKQTAGFRIEGVIDRTAYGSEAYAPAIGTELPFLVDMEIIAE